MASVDRIRAEDGTAGPVAPAMPGGDRV